MKPHAAVALICTLALAGCAGTTPPRASPPPEYFNAAPVPIPDAKAIIERESATFFDATANAKDIAISGVHPVDTTIGVLQGVCLRASLTNRNGGNMGTVFYVVSFKNDRIFDRRKAGAKDSCETDQYDVPLQFQPAVIAEPSKEPRKRNKKWKNQ
jgi:hypothetical protein